MSPHRKQNIALYRYVSGGIEPALRTEMAVLFTHFFVESFIIFVTIVIYNASKRNSQGRTLFAIYAFRPSGLIELSFIF
jgi:hypothetical protein